MRGIARLFDPRSLVTLRAVPAEPLVVPGVAGAPDPFTPPIKRHAAGWLESALRATGSSPAFDSARWLPGRARRVVRWLVNSAVGVARTLAGGLVGGVLPWREWAARFRSSVLASHLAAAQATVGTHDVPAPAYATLRDAVATQLAYLDRFARQVRSGEQARDGSLVGRAGLYGAAVWAVAQGVELAEAARVGLTEQLNVLGFADHCSDCLSESAAGWVPIGSGIPIGDRLCRVNCACHMEYRGGPAPGPAPTLADVERDAGVEFTRSEGAANAGDRVVIVDVARVDANLRGSDPASHVGTGGTGAAVAGRYAEFRRFLARAKAEGIAVEMPRMGLDADGNATVVNGRHRFAVFRDLGRTALPVTVDPADVPEFRRRYGAGGQRR